MQQLAFPGNLGQGKPATNLWWGVLFGVKLRETNVGFSDTDHLPPQLTIHAKQREPVVAMVFLPKWAPYKRIRAVGYFEDRWANTHWECSWGQGAFISHIGMPPCPRNIQTATENPHLQTGILGCTALPRLCKSCDPGYTYECGSITLPPNNVQCYE